MKSYKGSYLSYFLMYMFYYMGMALFSALISVYLMDKGRSASEVSLVVSSGMIMTMLLQPVVGNLNDRFDRKKVNSIILLFSACMGVLFIFSKSIIATAATYSLGLAAISTANPVIERMATTSKHKYSAIRIWGTIGYATGSQLGGIIYNRISPESMYVLFAVSMVVCIIGLYGTHEDRPIESAGATVEKRKLRISKYLIIYMLLACLFYGMSGVNSTYLPAMYRAEGLSVDMTTFILFLGTLMELPVILLSRFYMNRLSNKTLLQLSFIMLTVQFSAYAFIPAMPVQIAITFLTKSTVTMAFIMINIKVIATLVDPAYQMTALALVSTVKSLTGIGFQAAAGSIIDAASYNIFYAVLTGAAIAALVISCLLKMPDGNDQKLFS